MNDDTRPVNDASKSVDAISVKTVPVKTISQGDVSVLIGTLTSVESGLPAEDDCEVKLEIVDHPEVFQNTASKLTNSSVTIVLHVLLAS